MVHSVQKSEILFLMFAGRTEPHTQIFPVNIDKANSRICDVTLYMVYIGGPAEIRNPRIIVYIVRSQVQVRMSSVEFSQIYA